MRIIRDYVENCLTKSNTIEIENSKYLFHIVYNNDDEYRRNASTLKQNSLYFLIGFLDTSNHRTLYIGQTQDACQRLSQHEQKKDFWEYAIVCTSKENTLTKSQILYLEYLCITNSVRNGDFNVMNNVQIPSEPIITPADFEIVKDVFREIIVITNILGLNLYGRKPLVEKVNDEKSRKMLKRAVNAFSYTKYDESDDTTKIYTYKSNTCDISALLMSNDKFIIFKGSVLNNVKLDADKIYESIEDANKDVFGSSEETHWIITYET